MSRITAEYLRSRLHYDPDTGIFTWLPKEPSKAHNRQWNGQFAGKIAGCIVSHGYWSINLDLTYYYGHQLAWLYMTGEWPADEIDHKNRDRSNNRWLNLREATTSKNQANAGLQARNTSGYRGVCWEKAEGKWSARIMVNGKRHHLGLFDSPEEAAKAREAAALQYFGEFAA